MMVKLKMSKQYKILLVSGCSWTNKNFKSLFHPELDTTWPKWPELLAEKLNMKCVNLAMSGAGQEYIYSSILDTIQSYDTKEIGLIIPAWSLSPRRDYVVGSKWTNDRHDMVGDISYWITRSIRYYYSLQTICKQLKIPLKQFQMINLYKAYLVETNQIEYTDHLLKVIHNSPYYNKIDTDFLGWPTVEELGGFSVSRSVIKNQELKISEKDGHPNKKGQEQIAEFIYERLG